MVKRLPRFAAATAEPDFVSDCEEDNVEEYGREFKSDLEGCKGWLKFLVIFGGALAKH